MTHIDSIGTGLLLPPAIIESYGKFKLDDRTFLHSNHECRIGFDPSADTSMRIIFSTNNKPYQAILSISAPDKNDIVTVRFSRSKVKFINDSTFTYKQIK